MSVIGYVIAIAATEPMIMIATAEVVVTDLLRARDYRLSSDDTDSDDDQDDLQ